MSQRETDKRRISLELSGELLTWIDSLKGQLGLRSRGDLVERLLQEVRGDQSAEVESTDVQPQLQDAPAAGEQEPEPREPEPESPQSLLDEDVSIVLVQSGLAAQRDHQRDSFKRNETVDEGRAASSAASGIQLPGFVRKQAKRVKQTLEAPARSTQPDATLALIRGADLDLALHQALQHWSDVTARHQRMLHSKRQWSGSPETSGLNPVTVTADPLAGTWFNR